MGLQDTLRSIGATLRFVAKDQPGTDKQAAALFASVKEAYDKTSDARSETQKLRDFHNGDQIEGTGLNAGTRYVPTWPDETDDEFDTRRARMAQVMWNRIRDGVWQHADGLYAWNPGGGIARELTWAGDGEPDERLMERVTRFMELRVWRRNKINRFMWEVWERAGSEGQAVVLLQWLDGSARRLRPFGSVTASEMSERGVSWMEMIDNLSCILIPDELQPRELGGIIRWYRDPDEDSSRALSASPRPGERATITELVTDTTWHRWNGSTLQRHQWGTENRYGDVRTLFAVARNMGGVADSVDALGGQVVLLEHLYNASEVWRNHAFPDTLFAGFDPQTRKINGEERLMRGPTVAHVSPDANATILKVGLPVDLADVGVASANLHQMLDEALGVAGLARSSGGGLGQVRSAPAIAKLQGGSERRRRRKILAATEFERAMFRSVVDQWAYHSNLSVDEKRALAGIELLVTFPEDAFVSDPFTMAQTEQLEIAAGTTTAKDKMRQRQPDLPEAALDDKLTEAKSAASTDSGGIQPNPTARSRAQDATS